MPDGASRAVVWCRSVSHLGICKSHRLRHEWFAAAGLLLAWLQTIFFAKVLRSACEEQVRDLFARYGRVLDVKLFRAFKGSPTNRVSRAVLQLSWKGNDGEVLQRQVLAVGRPRACAHPVLGCRRAPDF